MTNIQESYEQTSDEIEEARVIEVEQITSVYKKSQCDAQSEYDILSEMYEKARERKRAALY